MSIQVVVKAELLGTPIDGVYNKITQDHPTFKTKAPNPAALNYTATTTLIFGSPEEPVKKSLTEVLEELSFGYVKKEDIKDRLPQKVYDFLAGTNVEVKTIYYLNSDNTSAQGKDKFDESTLSEIKKELGLFLDPTADAAAIKEFQKKKRQYAFHIEITLDQATQDAFPIKVSSIGFKIWSTDNEKVLEKMEITEVNKLLKGAGVPVIENA
jgi:hypothetical protein